MDTPSNYKSEWVRDMEEMHAKYGVHEWIDAADKEQLAKFMQFRLMFLQEELNETQEAFERGDAEEMLDGLIDLCVIAIGTMDAFNCDADGAWEEVFRANMNKEVGVKPSRPNPLGLPDLIKPEGWVGPDHTGKAGYLDLID